MTAKNPVKAAVQEEQLTAFEHFSTLGTGVQIAITRQPGNRYLEILPLEGLDEDMMRERYGGGKFQLRAREDGAFMKGAKIRYVEIEGAPKLFPPPEADPNAPEVARLTTELEKLTGKSGGDNSVMLGAIGLLAPVLTAMVTSAMDRPPPPDPIETLNLYRKMLKDDRADRPAGGESGLDPIVEKLGIPLLGEITKMREQGAAGPRPSNEPPSETTALPPNPAPLPSTLPELAAFVARWCAGPCARGTSPTLRAELFLEELSLQEPDLMESVIELSRVPDVMAHWVKLVPEVALNRDWYGAFIEEIRILAGEAAETEPAPLGEAGPDQGTENTEGGRGDESDVSGNGAPVPAGVAK